MSRPHSKVLELPSGKSWSTWSAQVDQSLAEQITLRSKSLQEPTPERRPGALPGRDVHLAATIGLVMAPSSGSKPCPRSRACLVPTRRSDPARCPLRRHWSLDAVDNYRGVGFGEELGTAATGTSSLETDFDACAHAIRQLRVLRARSMMKPVVTPKTTPMTIDRSGLCPSHRAAVRPMSMEYAAHERAATPETHMKRRRG